MAIESAKYWVVRRKSDRLLLSAKSPMELTEYHPRIFNTPSSARSSLRSFAKKTIRDQFEIVPVRLVEIVDV